MGLLLYAVVVNLNPEAKPRILPPEIAHMSKMDEWNKLQNAPHSKLGPCVGMMVPFRISSWDPVQSMRDVQLIVDAWKIESEPVIEGEVHINKDQKVCLSYEDEDEITVEVECGTLENFKAKKFADIVESKAEIDFVDAFGRVISLSEGIHYQ